MRYAAIDIGTVTCRLLVAEADDPAAEAYRERCHQQERDHSELPSATALQRVKWFFSGELATLDKQAAEEASVDACDLRLHELHREVQIVDLGQGVDASHRLDKAAMDRVTDCVRGYLERIQEFSEPNRPVETAVVATSAVRDAANASELSKRFTDLGAALTIVSGKQEAHLSFAGASAAYPGQPVMVVDVGGGSTEVVLGISGAEPAFSHSFDIGCRRMTERFLHADPPTAQECAQARQQISQQMQPVFDQMQPVLERLVGQGDGVQRLVCVAGTATSCVSIDRRMEVYDPRRVDGVEVARVTLRRIFDQLRSLPLEQRRQVVGLEPKRAHVIVAGLLILDVVMELAGMDAFTVSETDILQGIVMRLATSYQLA